MFYQLPPVGRVVSRSADAGLHLPSCLASGKTVFYDSGTASLAAALCAVKTIKNINAPEVILPAYACPDLISAAVFAGVKPVLVDFEKERPWLDLAGLNSAINENTIAIIAVNLFGIAERWPQLRPLADKADVILIEDSAQYFPGESENETWHGDLVVLSFGRGKPVSLLGGGAVVCRNLGLFDYLPKPDVTPVSAGKRFLFDMKTRLYNMLISPHIYWLLRMLPFLHLGETRYHELLEIEAMDQQRLDLLSNNIFRYQNDGRPTVCCEAISVMLSSVDKILNMPEICSVPSNHRLLRYPVLVPSTYREKIYDQSKRAGLGGSVMYPTSLSNMASLNQIIDNESKYPNADEFAARVFTLPINLCANRNNLEKMNEIFIKVFQ